MSCFSVAFVLLNDRDVSLHSSPTKKNTLSKIQSYTFCQIQHTKLVVGVELNLAFCGPSQVRENTYGYNYLCAAFVALGLC